MTSRARSHRLQVLDAGEPLDGVLGLPSGPPPDPPAGHADGRVPLAICCDGVAASLAATNDVADHLNQVGLATFRFTFRGRWPGGDMTGVSLLTEVADLDAVVDAARAGAAAGEGPWGAIDPERPVLLGQSQGGAVVLLTAARRPRLFAAVVAWHPALSIVDDLHRGLGSLDKVGETFSWMGQTLGRRYAADVWDLDIYTEIAGYTAPPSSSTAPPTASSRSPTGGTPRGSYRTRASCPSPAPDTASSGRSWRRRSRPPTTTCAGSACCRPRELPGAPAGRRDRRPGRQALSGPVGGEARVPCFTMLVMLGGTRRGSRRARRARTPRPRGDPPWP